MEARDFNFKLISIESMLKYDQRFEDFIERVLALSFSDSRAKTFCSNASELFTSLSDRSTAATFKATGGWPLMSW
jgi:hypothetical protein